jgi:osmotically-inducible protein OsmY
MRRIFLSAAIMAIVAGGPLQAQAGDREIAQQIIDRLKVHRDAGALKDFTLDLKVDQGVVLLRGSVGQAEQKANVLAAAQGIEGIAKVVDEIEVRKAGDFSLKEALATKAPGTPVGNGPIATEAQSMFPEPMVLPAGEFVDGVAVGGVQMASATETGEADDADSKITASVVSTLGAAQRQGRLKGFGVDVNTRGGTVFLNGRASSQEQRDLIAQLVRETPGVVDVMEEISVIGAMPHPGQVAELEPMPRANGGQQDRTGTPAMAASSRGQGVPVQPVPYNMGGPNGGQGVPAQQASMGMHAGVAGMPVPMAPYAGVGAGPRYEQPYLPNYAWPGYAAYPNYAAVSYPQQYSPSAFPYIGPFYPYPQVPLGWRRVSLEWDDGWWFLDFTDR